MTDVLQLLAESQEKALQRRLRNYVAPAVFPRQQSRSMSQAPWDMRLKPLRPLWTDWAAGLGLLVFLASLLFIASFLGE